MSNVGPVNKARRNIFTAALAATATSPTIATLLPSASPATTATGSGLLQPEQLFQDASWKLMNGEQIFTYAAGTLTPKTVYQDATLTTAHSNPILGTERGQIQMFGAGSYRIILKDALGNRIRDIDNIESTRSILNSVRSDIMSSLVAPAGASLIGFAQPDKTGQHASVQSVLARTVHVFDFMTDTERADVASGALALDMSAAIQKAINFVCSKENAVRAGHVHADPRYPMLVKTPLDCTNSRRHGSFHRDGLRFTGFNLVGETGEGNCVIETTGSQWLELDGIISSGKKNKSTVGLLQALSVVLPQTQNQKISLKIFLHDDHAANGGIGTVGVWNFGSEENTYHSLYVHANVGLFMTAHAQSPNIGGNIPSSFQRPLMKEHSCGVNTFNGETFLGALGRHRSSLITEDVNSVTFENLYMVNIGDSGGKNTDAWSQYGMFQGGVIQGTVEQHGSLRNVGVISATKIRLTFGIIHQPTIAHINQIRGGQGWIIDSDINFQNAASHQRQLFSCTPVSPNEKVSCYIRNSVFRLNSDSRFCIVPENVAWNPNTGNVSIYAADGDKPFYYNMEGSRRIKMEIPAKNCHIDGSLSSAEVVRFIGPTVFGKTGGANALSAKIRIEGMASMLNPGTNANSIRFVDATILILIDSAGAITVSDALITAQSQLDQNPQGNSITALNFRAVVKDGTAAIFLTPTLAGANRESITFAGTAEMTWSGNESRAPRLAT